MSKALAKQETQQLAPVESPQSFQESMDEAGVSMSDIMIPKLLLQQNTSEAVGDDKAKLGDIMNSQTLEILGGLDSPLEVIPLKLFKTWVIMDMSGKQAEFLKSEPLTAANSQLPWEDNVDGMPIRRDECMNFFVLIKKEVDADMAFPVLIQFKRTSSKAGKQLATQFVKMGALNRPTYSMTVKLAVKKEKYETNTYAKFEIQGGSVVDAKTLAIAKDWMEKLKVMTYKVDDAPEKEVERSVGPTVVGPSTTKEAPTDLY